MGNISDWVSDYLHLIKGTTIMYLTRTPPKHYLGQVDINKAPVILVPGVLGRWAFFKDLGDKISLKNHAVYIVPELGNNLKDIPKSAEIVREVIDKNNIKNGIIVAHSKGGLIGKYLLTYLNSDNRIKKMISIATPYSGSSMAKIIPYPPFKELLPRSKIIEDLKSHSEANSKIISISPIFDNHVWAKEGSFLEGAKNITINERGHHKILFNKELQETVLSSLG